MENLARLMEKGKSDKKILIELVHSLQEPWLDIVAKGQKLTWLDLEYSSSISIEHFFATPPSLLVKRLDKINEYLRWKAGPRVSRIRNKITRLLLFPWRNWVPKISPTVFPIELKYNKGHRIHLFDMYLTTRWKRLSVIDYFYNHTIYDYLVISTSSSYFQPDLLLERLEAAEEDVTYAGPVLGAGPTNFFVSGAQTIMNRNAAKMVISKRSLIPVELLDDLGLGVFFEKMGVSPINMKTLNLSSLDEFRTIPDSLLRDHHHFRLKAETNGIRKDPEIFLKLHSIILDNTND